MDAPFPLTRQQIIEIRDRHKGNADVRALLLEIKRQHRVILLSEQYRRSIDRAWKEETESQLVALHQFRLLLQDELGRFADDPPMPY